MENTAQKVSKKRVWASDVVDADGTLRFDSSNLRELRERVRMVVYQKIGQWYSKRELSRTVEDLASDCFTTLLSKGFFDMSYKAGTVNERTGKVRPASTQTSALFFAVRGFLVDLGRSSSSKFAYVSQRHSLDDCVGDGLEYEVEQKYGLADVSSNMASMLDDSILKEAFDERVDMMDDSAKTLVPSEYSLLYLMSKGFSRNIAATRLGISQATAAIIYDKAAARLRSMGRDIVCTDFDSCLLRLRGASLSQIALAKMVIS